MKSKIESVIECEMETIVKLKYQGATEMFRKIQTTPLMNDEKIMNSGKFDSDIDSLANHNSNTPEN